MSLFYDAGDIYRLLDKNLKPQVDEYLKGEQIEPGEGKTITIDCLGEKMWIGLRWEGAEDVESRITVSPRNKSDSRNVFQPIVLYEGEHAEMPPEFGLYETRTSKLRITVRNLSDETRTISEVSVCQK